MHIFLEYFIDFCDVLHSRDFYTAKRANSALYFIWWPERSENKNSVICLKSENLHKRGGRGTAKDKMSIMAKNRKPLPHKFQQKPQNCNISYL